MREKVVSVALAGLLALGGCGGPAPVMTPEQQAMWAQCDYEAQVATVNVGLGYRDGISAGVAQGLARNRLRESCMQARRAAAAAAGSMAGKPPPL